MKGKITVKDKEGNNLQVDINNPRYLSGELVGLTKGTITVKDINGKYLKVNLDDSRYLSGELVFNLKGLKHTEETKKKMSDLKKGKYKGKENSQYNTCWIYNLELKESKKIKKEEITYYLDNNWIKGRKMKF